MKRDIEETRADLARREAEEVAAGYQWGASFARGLRTNNMVERHMARRLRALDFLDLAWANPGLEDALGHGVVLVSLLDPNHSRFARDRDSCERLAEWVTGTPYPTWERLCGALESAQDELEAA